MKAASYKTSKFVDSLFSRYVGKKLKMLPVIAVLYIGKNSYFQLSKNDDKCQKSIIKLSYRQSRGQISLLTTIIYLVNTSSK